MKYYRVGIIGLFFLCFIRTIVWASAELDSTGFVDSGFLSPVVELSGAMDGSGSGNFDATGNNISGMNIENSEDELVYGDLQIEEIFPGSGNCLDEYIQIVAHKPFSGYVDILGAGVSSGVVRIRVNMYSGERLIVTDDVAGMQTTWQIILLPSITLTNGGEVIQLWYSGSLLDDIWYADPHGASSLLYTETMGEKRYFKTIVNAQIPSYCSSTIPDITSSPVLGGCSIDVTDIQYHGSGNYSLHLASKDGLGCEDNAVYKWYNGTQELSVGVCQTNVEVGPGVHRLSFYSYSDTGVLVCSDEFIFTSQYDVGYISIQNNSPGQCQNNAPITLKSPTFAFYDAQDCGIELQSPKLGFTVNSALNMRLVLNGSGLNDTQKKYECSIDMGDGQIINECNPSTFHYKFAGIYTMKIIIKEAYTGQPICTHSSFLYIPNASPISNKGDINGESGGVNSGENNTMYCNSGVYNLHIYSLVPNPKGNDDESEIIVLTGDVTQDLLYYSIRIGKKSFVLSGMEYGKDAYSIQKTWGLVNKGMCIDLLHKYCGLIQHVCYNAAKDNDVLYCASGEEGVCMVSDYSGFTVSDTGNITKELTCTEKIIGLKKTQQEAMTTLRNKHKIAIAKLRSSNTMSIKNYREKEKIARNSLYVLERGFALVQKILAQNDGEQELYLRDVKGISDVLISHIKRSHYILSKSKKSKTYTYNTQAFLTQYYVNSSLISTLFPDMYDDMVDFAFVYENK